MKIWKIIAVVLANKAVRDILYTLAVSISDGKLTSSEKKELLDKITNLVKSYV